MALKRPDAPLELLFKLAGKNKADLIGNRKQLKKQSWLVCDQSGALSDLKGCRYLDDEALAQAAGLDADRFASNVEIGHNSISRLTGTTGGNGFDPFTSDSRWYAPGCRLALIIGIDESMLPLDSLVTGLMRMGQSGFGRDASTGAGKFSVLEQREINLPAFGAAMPNALYTLTPCVPEPERYQDALFSPFTRFGRHGDRLAVSGKPYKTRLSCWMKGRCCFRRRWNRHLPAPIAAAG